MAKGGFDITPFSFTYFDKNSLDYAKHKEISGQYDKENDLVWVMPYNINEDDLEIIKPNLGIFFHELGHREHCSRNENCSFSEAVSLFFYRYFTAVAHTILDDEARGLFERIKNSNLVNPKYCEGIPSKACRYTTGAYAQYKSFGEYGGNFNSTLNNLVNSDASKNLEEYYSDFQNGYGCAYLEAGIQEYEEFVMNGTHRGIVDKETWENSSKDFYRYDSCFRSKD